MVDPYIVGSAFFNSIRNAGTIATYYQKAPQSATTPYTLVYFMTANDEYAFGNSDGLNADYIVKVVSSQDKQYHPEIALALYSSVHSNIQDIVFSIPGYNVIKIRRESILTYEDQMHFWNVGGLYNLQIWKQ
jgi:phosphosulfolactate phosphohydrolase-like enzyme